jgi:tripartite-type tricarboxylate transporter receptor subunit TctC
MGMWFRTASIILTSLLFVLAHSARAQTPVDFYKDRTIRFIGGSPPGGGHDIHLRAFARHLSKFVPGQPGVIVQVIPTAGGLAAGNYVHNVSKPDGLTIGNFPGGNILLDLVGDPRVQFDSRKFQWIGTMSSAVGTCFARHDSGFKTIADIIGSPKPLILGSSGRGTTMSIHPRALNAVLGTNFEVVEGYPGAAGVYAAIERGEIHGACGLFWSSIMSARPDWVSKGFIRVFLQLGFEKHPDFPDIPLVMDVVKSPEDRMFLEALFAPLHIARPFFVHPQVPPERVKILREGFLNTLKDPSLLKEAERARLEITPSSGEKVQSLVEKMFATPQGIVKRIAELLK